MKTNAMAIKILMLSALLCFASVGCKNDTSDSPSAEANARRASSSSKSKKQAVKRKIIKGIVEVQFDVQTVSFSDFDQNVSTDVVYLNNGIQFRINSVDNQSVLVNMYTPDFFEKIPVTISQQTSALSIEESYKVKTQSRLEVVIPTIPENKRDYKVLYDGTVTLNELSENRLVVTFSGRGSPFYDTKGDFFPMEGKIVLENFNVYDIRF